MSVYAGILVDKIRKATGEERPFEGFKIIVDAGNGAGGFYVDKVLAPSARIPKAASSSTRTGPSPTTSRIRKIKRR